MEVVVVLGILFALLLGTGAARESAPRLGFGLLGVVVMAVASFFVMSVVHAVLFVLGLLVLFVLSWIISPFLYAWILKK